MKYTILVADDEEDILEVAELFLSQSGFQVIKAVNDMGARKIIDENQIHLAILDIMMPISSGIEVLRYIQSKSKIPVLFLTAKTQDYDKIMGLKLGADDYITKPFNPIELVARVESVLRRTYEMKIDRVEKKVIVNGWVSLCPDEARVLVHGKEIELTATEFRVLKFFMSNIGRIYTRKQIFEAVHNEEFMEDDNSVLVHISNLRNKLEDDSKSPSLLRTIRGLGYRMDQVVES